MKKYLLIFVAGITMLACAPKSAEIVTEEASPAIPSASVSKGKTIYETKCIKCHALKTIKNHTTEQWAMILPKMAIKAKLINDQEALVNEYIQWELAK